MLAVGASIIYGIILALGGKWKELFIMIAILIVAIWILGALGLELPSIPVIH